MGRIYWNWIVKELNSPPTNSTQMQGEKDIDIPDTQADPDNDWCASQYQTIPASQAIPLMLSPPRMHQVLNFFNTFTSTFDDIDNG